MKKKISGKTIFNLSVVVLCIGMLGYFFLSDNGLLSFLKSNQKIEIEWLIVAILCHLLNIAIDAYLIYRFTSNNHLHYSFRNALKSSMVGQFFSCVTPFASGGQPMQIYVMSKQGVSPGISTAGLMQKFLVYQSTLTVYSLLAILLRWQFFQGSMKIMGGAALVGFASQAIAIVGILLFSFNRKITHKLLTFIFTILAKLHIIKDADTKIKNLEIQFSSFHDCNRDLYRNRKLLLETYVATAIQLTAIFIVPYCVYRAFSLNGARVIDMVASQAFVTMVSCFVPLPGAAGGSELSFMGFFGMFFTQETLQSAVLVWRLITYYGTIVISMPFSHLAKREKKRRKFRRRRKKSWKKKTVLNG